MTWSYLPPAHSREKRSALRRSLDYGTVLKRDLEIPPDVLVEKLMATGYMREDPVSAVGEFSMRGGIVDIWPPGLSAPVRIEFFGDTNRFAKRV
jgi:transcription-repair coupling factor (superfamily II helicase)